MRISPISYAQPRNVRNVNTSHKEQITTPSFNGWQAGAAGLTGGAVGSTVGAMVTGGFGLAAILLGMGGTYIGALFGKASEKPASNGSGKDFYCGSNRDS